MQYWHEVFRWLALSQILLTIVVLSFSLFRFKGMWGPILFLATIAGYLSSPLAYSYAALPFVFFTFLLSNLCPLLFWIFNKQIFDDRFGFVPPFSYRVFAAGALISVLVLYNLWLLSIAKTVVHIEGQISWLISHAISFSFLSLAIWESVRNWRDDLVAPRRRLRGIVLTVTALYMGTILFVELLFLQDIPIWVEVLNSSLLCFLLSIFCVALLLPNSVLLKFAENHKLPHLFTGSTTNEISSIVGDIPLSLKGTPASGDENLIQALMQAMDQGFYRSENLTIRILAEHLKAPEYRLRSLINQRLGFRNFSDFLNDYRIQEARQRLSADNAPILNIALDLGYRSLSTFNKAFRDRLQMTPSEYRKSNITPIITDEIL